MNAEIIGIGSELLLGQIANTDAQFISEQLSALGIDVFWHTTVGDNYSRVLQALKLATERSDIVITTGGLGPTMDDITKEAVTEFLGLKLEIHPPSLQRIQKYFKSLGRNMSENNIKQAMFPKEAIVFENKNGTAPGAIIENNNKIYIILPGPPMELQPMFKDFVYPYLLHKTKHSIYSQIIHVFGIGESVVEECIKDLLLRQSNPTIAPLAGSGEVILRITAKAETQQKAIELIKPIQKEIENRLGDAVYGYNTDTLESVVVQLLRKNGLRLALAESCTGGNISNMITNNPGSSEVFLESCVTYSNNAKIVRLGVSPDTLEKHGAVSDQVAKEMAEGILRTSGSDIGAAVTGIAGPGGATKSKPIGLVYMAIASKERTLTKMLRLRGNRLRIKRDASMHLLNWLRLYLQKTYN
ncbi:MAG: competence/damage-inducible protein A [Caldicoprobacterales bacterium]|jgi:nicotinamide-nucleotide amidase